ncbi:triose-phosphate isomerase, partial [Campylobacter coli]
MQEISYPYLNEHKIMHKNIIHDMSHLIQNIKTTNDLKENELNFIQGAQNFYPCVNGAFTGELGKEHLDEFGIKCVLIGH